VYSLRSKSSEGRRLYLERLIAKRQLVDKPAFLTRIQIGNQARLDIVAMAKDLTIALREREPLGNELSRVLFDCSEVTSWPYQAPPQKSLQHWKKTVPQIFRAAFVHHRRWDRHVALLAALLRSANAEVRSFSPEQLDDAISWLASDPATITNEDETNASAMSRNEGQAFSARR
jgi:hypothetical protein